MAITNTNKLGLPLYSAGTDPHPGRVDHNTIMQAINDNAMGVKQGLHAERPGAGVAGRTYFSTDRNTAAYDNGTTWVEYVPIGGLAPSGVRAGATGPVLDGTGGNEGMSTKLARADHTHAVPLATDDLPGLMNADMFYLLARMTDAATPSTVVRRDAAARISVGTPTSAAHASTKAYADLVASDASRLSTGTIPAARLPLATKTVAGAMSAADKTKLDGAAYNGGASTVMMTNNLNQVKASAFFVDNVAEQLQYAHALTRKDYVDGLNTAARAYADSLVGTSAAPLAHQHDAADVNSGVFAVARLPMATASAAGAMSAAHFALLAGATSAATANTLVKNDANGRFQTVTPSAAADVANKGYVDGKKWSGADITTGTVSPDRIANATSALDGLMPKDDKAKLDGAVPAATALALVRRDTAGRFQVPAPSSNALDVVNRGYVDGKTWSGADITSGLIDQARIANATSSLNGLMSSADKAKLDGATPSATPNSIPYRNANGLMNVAAPVYADNATTKAYVDGQDAKQVSISGQVPNGTINGVVNTGEYYQSSAAQVTVENGYPYNGTSGTLKVMQYAGGMGTYVVQHWLSASGERAFFRSSGNGGTTWRAWVEFANTDYASDASNLTKGTVNPARIANATASLDGLMAKADKAKLDAATVYKTANTLPLRNAQGNIDVGTPTNNNQATPKGYVDGYKVLWTGAMYMQEAQVVTLPEGIMDQKTGIVLVWGGFDNGSVANHSFTYDFIPKAHIELFTGYGVICTSVHSNNAGTPQIIVKYVYVSNTRITGNDANKEGIANLRVLRAVIGV